MRSLALAIALVTVGTVAHADPSAEDRKTAEKYFHAGEKAYEAQNFLAAAQNFEAAYKALPLPEIAFSAAQAYRRQYRVEPKLELAQRAVALYRIYLDQVKTGGRVGIAADNIGEMQREAEKLLAAGMKAAAEAVAVERTRLGVSPVLDIEHRTSMREIGDMPDPSRVSIRTQIDGKSVPPFEMVDVAPGPHTIHVEAEGYVASTTVERVVKGASIVAEIALRPEPARVTVHTEDGAHVRVDGRLQGTAPLAPFELPAGRHLITVARAGRYTISKDVELSRGQRITLDAELATTPRRHAVPFVGIAAGAVAVFSLSGLVYGAIEDGRADDVLARIGRGDQQPAAITEYQSHIDRRDQVLTGSLITGGIALGLGAATAILYWWDRPDEEGMRVTPTASAGGAGVSVSGRF
ncbi:MAG TPA: PEGA domain-containing protein [Kofleriaceae bacterium]|nr:PEGA domain-containing protein [Kofleriaceae bacterium]